MGKAFSVVAREVDARIAAGHREHTAHRDGGIPVSYTHLDVYKRQVLERHIQKVLQLAELHDLVKLFVQILGREAQHRAVAVSYTHLATSTPMPPRGNTTSAARTTT